MLSKSNEYSADRQDISANQNNYIENSVIICRQVGEFASAIQCLSEAIAAYKEEDTSQKDLKAQHHMSVWALGVFLVSGITFLVTLAGVFLVWRTLVYTRETLNAARRANHVADRANDAAFAAVESAKQANDLSRNMGELETRAYLSASDVEMITWEDPNLITIRFTLTNTGVSPADLPRDFSSISD